MNELIRTRASGHCKFKTTSPRRMWAEIYLVVEPIAGKENEIVQKWNSGYMIPREFHAGIYRGSQEALESGVLQASPFIGVRVLLIDGAHHDTDSSNEAFRIAAFEATMDALKKASPYVQDTSFEDRQRGSTHSDRQEDQKRRSSRREREDNEDTRSHDARPDRDAHYAMILGITGPVTEQNVKQRWRDLAKQYHPDNVHHLGPKLKALAEQEMKAINAAYEYFRKKYGM